jgi:L-lactate dehydrogenase complex protein LldE
MSADRVLLLPTCLVDILRPSVGVSASTLLSEAGCRVEVSRRITCCGQPAYNSGDRRLAIRMAKSVIRECEPFQRIVLPSGSCASMIRHHYVALLDGEGSWQDRARSVAAKTHELTSFLVDVKHCRPKERALSKSVTYHDSCAGLRALEIRGQPRRLLAAVKNLELTEMRGTEECCGFGGTFCVKYPEISNRMVTNKCSAIVETGAQLVLGTDLGCLMNIAGKLSRLGSSIEVRHVAEVLAGEPAIPPLCSPPRAVK